MAKAIEFILTPLTRLMDGIKWISENMPSWEGIKNSVSSAWERTKTLRATLGNQQKKRQEVLGNHLRISLALVQMAKNYRVKIGQAATLETVANMNPWALSTVANT